MSGAEQAQDAVGTASGVLSGIRVADFSRVLAGPYATMMLADFGADVIKIEPPSGDETRSWRPPVDASGSSTYFGSVNRNKRSIVCDLSTDAGLGTARRLAATADVVIENFRPGVMERFGLDEATLRQQNPGVVYCSITGFGHDSGAALPGYDLLVQAVGGLMSITGPAEGEPVKVGVALVDVLTGTNALAGILLALRQRDAHPEGRGSRVDVTLLGSLLSAMTNQAASTLATGSSPARLGNAHPSIAPYELFQAADRDLVIAVGNDQQFAGLAGAIGAPELATDARFASNPRRVASRSELYDELSARLRMRPAAEWVATLVSAGVPAGLVNTIGEAFELADRLGLNPVRSAGADGRTSAQVADPIRLSGAEARYDGVPPELGEHDGATWLSVRMGPLGEQEER